jgi:carbohydrate kinase (thermoresistant glucokinase family)
MQKMVLVEMGVSGSGKTTIAQALADRLGWAFQEGDALHPQANVDKMHAGIPLTDEDRWPWLRRVAAWVDGQLAAGQPGIITCSLLKRAYRDLVIDGRQGVRLLYLKGDKALIADRMARRKGHFMPASLLDSQFATLEEPGPDEHPLAVDISGTADEIVDHIMRELAAASPTP